MTVVGFCYSLSDRTRTLTEQIPPPMANPSTIAFEGHHKNHLTKAWMLWNIPPN